MSKSLDQYVDELNSCIKEGQLVQVPGNDVYDYLYDFCDNATAISNYEIAQHWAYTFGDKFPKFVMVAYAMVLFKSFTILQKMKYGEYGRYDEVLTGLWIHYVSIPRKC